MAESIPSHPLETGGSTPLPRRFVTGHDAQGKAIIEVVDEGQWTSIPGANAKYNVFWATRTFPVDIGSQDAAVGSLSKQQQLEQDDDETTTTSTASSSSITASSLSLPNGTVLRFVDRAPHSEGPMHRTQSLDYGVVLEGEAELLLDSGERVTMRRGDVCVQRVTIHRWVNGTGEWNRMLFVLVDALPLEVGGKRFEGETGLGHIGEIEERRG